MAYKRTSPQPVIEGGTGAITLTGVLTGNGTSAITANTVTQYGTVVAGASNAVSSVAPSATSGIPYISQGNASNPTFGTAVVAGGGTGAVTLTGVLTGNGTSAVTANTVTQHGVLIGGATNAVSSLGVAATGTVLAGNTGADPSFQTLSGLAVTSISGTANQITASASTGAVTLSIPSTFIAPGSIAATTTLTASSGNITASSGTLVVSSPVTVANGGTGLATLTAHSIQVGNGTSTVTQLAVGATGTVLTGVTGADPVFSATPTVTSITFGSGSALATFSDWASFTPTVTGASTAGTTTYSTQSGQWMRIGNMVTVNIFVSYSAATGTGLLVIGGLPVTISSSSIQTAGPVFISGAAYSYPAGTTSTTIQGSTNTTNAVIECAGTANAGAAATIQNTATTIIGSFTYRA